MYMNSMWAFSCFIFLFPIDLQSLCFRLFVRWVFFPLFFFLWFAFIILIGKLVCVFCVLDHEVAVATLMYCLTEFLFLNLSDNGY